MITAKEAKQLYDKSDAEAEQFLSTKVEPKVIEAATQGKRCTYVFIDATDPWKRIEGEITNVHRRVIDMLIDLGYVVTLCYYGDKYVPRGLADDAGNGPEYQNYGIRVCW